MSKIALPLCALAVAAAPFAAPAHVIEQVVGLGQRADLGDGVSLVPLKVIEDSRCPAQVTCVWAGQVVIKATVRDHGRRTTVRLTLGKPLAIGKWRITLDQVSPARSQGPMNPRAYRFGFSYAPGLPQPGMAAPD